MCALLRCLFLVTGPPSLAQDAPLLYLPFDTSCEAVIAVPGVRVASAGDVTFTEGLVGRAAMVNVDCRYDVGAAFPTDGGSFAAWIRPAWPGSDPTGRTLMCIYGPADRPDGWMRNRWSIVTGDGKLRFFVFPGEGGTATEIAADISLWQADTWHHVAATWAWLGSAKDGALRLCLDGELAAEATGLSLSVGQPGSVLDIGRDSDASPDYADAVFDEVFLYARPLTAGETRTGVAQARSGVVAAPTEPPAPPREVEGWACPGLPYRAIVETEPQDRARTWTSYEAPLGLAAELTQLAANGAPDAAGFRLLPFDAQAPPRPLSFRLSGDRLGFSLPGEVPAGAVTRVALYFDVTHYEPVAPLIVARRTPQRASEAGEAAPAPDYAHGAYLDAWDFDEGDTEAIDHFGDKPEYFRDVRVANGALTAHVLQDPYVIWGSMWGPEDRGERPVRIDLGEFSVLEMRVRQSLPSAQWVVFGRLAGTDTLQRHPFPVVGTGWQVIRIDLAEEAHWGGTLSAFRIDPTEEVEADIAIDYVRLLSVCPARRHPIELRGDPSGVPARIGVSVAKREATAGEEQPLTVQVQDAGGAPVAGQPVRVWLGPGSGGTLAPQVRPALRIGDRNLRGLTDADGKLVVAYAASPRARDQADTICAATEFPSLDAEALVVDTEPGPPDHYRVLSDGVTVLHEAQAPFEVPVEPVDRFGNPTRGPAPTTFQVADGRVEPLGAAGPDGRVKVAFRPDLSRRWVYVVSASSEALQGQSGPICVLPRGPRPNPVSLGENGYFRTANGLPYLPLGGFYINWVGLPDPATGEMGRAIRSFTDVTEAQTREWLAFLHNQGVNTLRLMLRTHTARGLEPMDIGGRVNRPLLARTLRLLDLARPYGIRFLLVVHDDYDKPVYCNAGNLERFSLPQFAGEDLDALPPHQRRFIRDRELLRVAHEKYTDPDAIRCQDDYARELIGYLKDNPQVFAYELENEMVDCPQGWAAHAIEVIRAVDGATPICVSHGGGGLHTADPLWWTTQTPIDFYTYHLYPLGTTSPELDYGAGVFLLAKYGMMAGTCFLGESAGDEFSEYPPERDADRRYLMRDIIWMSLIAGNPGCMFWNARGNEVEEFRLAAEVMGQIDWTRWKRARPGIAVKVQHPLDGDKHYRTPEGTAERTMMGRYVQHLLSQSADFDLTVQAGGHAATANLDDFAPPGPPEQPFRVSPGFQLASLTREGQSEGLVYVRNFAGVREWEVPKRGRMWLRDRKAAPLTVELDLGAGEIAVRYWDLDTREAKEVVAGGQGTLDLGTTEHDFALWWRRR